MTALFVLVFSYFVGAIPFGLIIAKRFYGIDIREHGSKNPGATNVWRVLGAKPGATTLALDILKGALGVIAARLLCPGELGVQVVAGILAIVGHNWSVFMKGRGGKGVATSAGVFLALMPVHALIAISVFAAAFYATRYVSVGSIAASVALFVAAMVIPTPAIFRVLVAIAAAMVIYKHIPNMKRLAAGQELKVKPK